MQRRTFLASIGVGTLSLAGCTAWSDSGSSGRGTDEAADLPEDCPTTQGLDVDWPGELDAPTVETFVEEYEWVYYRDVVVEYEDSRFSSYQLSGQVSIGPTRVGGGYVVEYSGDGAIYETELRLRATTSEPPDGADIVQMSAIDDSRLADLLIEAAETGEADDYVPDTETRRYIDLLASLSEDFDPLPGWGTSDTLYVDVETTIVDLTAEAIQYHGDYGWTSRYYVDEQVVRRTTEEGIEPQNGTLVECRTGE
ncbi:hypothetical protein [Salinigranum sp. GCM10025319]|uniref:hypothetical protein n=1 Tax=Salinigranum sp. GCM10025319 TaxID=3252687 RepID=UPI0036066BB9